MTAGQGVGVDGGLTVAGSALPSAGMYDLPSRHRPLRPLLVGAVVTATTVTVGLAVSRATPAHARPVVHVSTASELGAALASAVPGDTIDVADGTYEGDWSVAQRPGTASAPITLTGSRRAVLRTPDGDGAVLTLRDADYWTVSGLTVEHGGTGVVVSSSDHVVLDRLLVHDLDGEGVRFRDSSRHGFVRASTITDTGRAGQGSGGIVAGTRGALSDRSDDLTVRDDVVGPLVRGPGVVAQAGTTGGLVAGSLFDGTGSATGTASGRADDGAATDAWVVVAGNDYSVEGNRGLHASASGFAAVEADGWGCGTVFRGNTADLTETSGGAADGAGSRRYAVDVARTDGSTADGSPADGSATSTSGTGVSRTVASGGDAGASGAGSADACPTTVYDDNEVVGGNGLVSPGVDVVSSMSWAG